MSRAVFVLLAFGACATPAAAAAMTPVQKVIELMNGMVAKGKEEKQAEQVQFAAYKQFCDDTQSSKQKGIKQANEKIDVLAADIEDYETTATELSAEIARHDEDISTWTGDLKAANKVREIENTGYTLAHKDYTESIQAIDDGIATLKKQSEDVAQAEATTAAPTEGEETLLQTNAHEHKKHVASALKKVSGAFKIPAPAKHAIEVFLAQDPDEDLAFSAPEANAFNFQSQGIVDMLTNLQTKFIDERTEMEKMETEARQAFEMLTMDLKSQIDLATSSRTEKSEAKAKALQGRANGKGDLEDTTVTRDDDSKYLADLTATCEQKASAFAQRQTLRAEELEALQKAIDIIASGAVAGADGKHIHKLIQLKGNVSLAQLRSTEQNPAQLRVEAFLRDQAQKLNSRVLSVLATRVAEDPFKKVKKMIKDLIVKLLDAANEEASHKGWCDTEMGTNAQTRKEKTEAVATLNAEIDELGGSIARLTQEITDLTTAVSDLSTAMAQATEMRGKEKEKNAATVKDAQGGQTAVAQAIAVLKEFYDKASKATSFVQQQPEAPAIFEEPYRGMGESSGGVVGMMEVIQSDFARLESETEAAEAEGQKQYEDFLQDTEVDKTQKKADIEHKSSKKQNQERALEEKKADLEGTNTELAAALTYYEKLKPSCVDEAVSYDDRVSRRKEEIESLQEALKILTE